MSTFAGRYGPETLFNGSVALLPGRQVRVLLAGTATPATLYTDRTKTTGAANPFTVDSPGNVTCFAAPGDYDTKWITNGVDGTAGPARVFGDPLEAAAGGAPVGRGRCRLGAGVGGVGFWVRGGSPEACWACSSWDGSSGWATSSKATSSTGSQCSNPSSGSRPPVRPRRRQIPRRLR